MAEVLSEFRKKLEKFKSSIQSTRLHLAEYFDKLKNEIDIEAEQCLNKSMHIKTTTDVQKSTFQDTINSNRTQMIDEIEKHEKKCFENLKNALNLENDLEAKEPSLIFLNMSEFKKCFSKLNYKIGPINYENSANDEENFYKGFVNVSKPTTFGFLYILNDCVLNEGFK